MSGTILNILEGAVDVTANVSEHFGAVFGEEEAKTLSLQITALGGGIEGIAAAAEEHPFLALAGVAAGIAIVEAVGPIVATGAAIAEAASEIAGVFGVSELGATALGAAAEAGFNLAVSAGVEGAITDLGSLGGFDVETVANTAAGEASNLASGSISAGGVQLPTDGDSGWGQGLGSETYIQYNAMGDVTGTLTVSNNQSENITNNAGAQVSVSGASVQSQSIDSSGQVTVNTAAPGADINGGNGTQLTVNGSAATIRLGDNANLTDNTSGSSDTTGDNSTVNIYGDGTTLTTGSTCTDGIHCVGDTVDTTGSQVNVDGSDSQVTINGSGDGITGTAGSELTIENTAGGGSADTVSGTSLSITDAGGAAITLNTSQSSITAGNGAVITDAGTGDQFTVGDNSNVTITGTDDHGATGILTVGTVDGSNNGLVVGGGSTLYLNGYNNAGQAANGSTTYVTGTSDGIVAADGWVTFSGANEAGQLLTGTTGTLTSTATNDSVWSPTGNSSNTVTDGGTGDHVTLNALSNAVVTGSSDTDSVGNVSPVLPPFKSRVRSCRHVHRVGVSLSGRAPFLRLGHTLPSRRAQQASTAAR